MKITHYLASLLPTFGKDQVMEDARITRTELKDNTIPLYLVASTGLRGYVFKDDVVLQRFQTYSHLVASGPKPFFAAVHERLTATLANLDGVEALVGKTYNEEIAGSALTYQKAHMLQFIELASFVSRYARRFLSLVYTREAALLPDSGTVVTVSFPPADLAWLDSNFVAFCNAIKVTGTPPAELKRILAQIPDVVVTPENAQTLGVTLGVGRVDPFQLGLVAGMVSPVYHVAMMVAEWQANRYKAAQEERRLVELRKLHLERLIAGKPDAKLQQEIDYLESRIQGLNYKLAKMERDHA